MDKLIITYDMWGSKMYTVQSGKKVHFRRLQEARDYAKQMGLSGIKVQYHKEKSNARHK